MSTNTMDRQRAMVDWFNAAELDPLSAAETAALERLMRWPTMLDVGALPADESVRSTMDRINAENRAAVSRFAAHGAGYRAHLGIVDEIHEYETALTALWWENPHFPAERTIIRSRQFGRRITIGGSYGARFMWLMDEEHAREVAAERQQYADSVPARNYVRAYVARRLVEDHLAEYRLSAIVDALTGASVTAR